MFGRITYSISDFHPSLREGFQREIDRIHRDTPPVAGFPISLVVTDKPITRCGCGKCDVSKMKDYMEGSYAVTHSSIIKGDTKVVIYFNAALFGVDGDVADLQSRLDLDYGMGSLTKSPIPVLTHEYGHYLDFVISQKFGRGEDDDDVSEPAHHPVAREYEAVMEQVFNAIPRSLRLLMVLFGNAPMTETFNRETDPFPSSYAYTSRREFFAESFAAVYHGDPRQKALKFTQMIKGLVELTYLELRAENEGRTCH